MSAQDAENRPSTGPTAIEHLISFDVEEYFQVEAAVAGVSREDWDRWPSRVEPAVDVLLELLERHDARATFFILGWLAQRKDAMVRRIARAGHEIASHGMSHRMIGGLTPQEFARDVGDSRRLLQDLSGQEVLGYRAPTFSVTHKTAWALDALVEAGYVYDSSVFPIRHDRYGVPDAPRFAHRAVGPGGGTILEVPPLTWRLLGTNLPAGGGGYLRLLPVRLIGRALRAAQRRGHSAMIYLHPWEVDPDQPVLPMGRFSRWRHRVGLGRTAAKLDWLLGRFRFATVRDRLRPLTEQAREEFAYAEGRDG